MLLSFLFLSILSWSYFLLSSEQNPEECDATDDASSTSAWFIISIVVSKKSASSALSALLCIKRRMLHSIPASHFASMPFGNLDRCRCLQMFFVF